jgi:hypothetical protein
LGSFLPATGGALLYPGVARRGARRSCSFSTRCLYAPPRCRDEQPLLRAIGNGRKVACHFDLLDHPAVPPGLVDRVVVVPDVESIAAARRLSEIIGRPCGGSTRTNICAVFKLIEEMIEQERGGAIVTLLCDSGSLKPV